MTANTPFSVARRDFVRLSAAGAAALLTAKLTGVNTSAAFAAETAFKPGTYTGVGQGKGGPVTVETTFDEGSILSVEVVDHSETPWISEAALTELPARIVETQSLGIDGETGATITSAAVLAAVADCAEQAQADVKALQQTPAAVGEPQVIDMEADIVVVGAGISGMTAAVAAAQQGAQSVVVFEKNSRIGGNAVVSAGLIHYIDAPEDLRAKNNAGFDSYFNQTLEQASERSEELGIPQEVIDEVRADYEAHLATGTDALFDSPDFLAIEYQIINGGTFSKWRNYAHILPKSNAWLESLGVEWSPLHSIVGFAWPRWVGPKDGVMGMGYFQQFDKTVEEENLPVTILTSTPASELIIEDDTVMGAVGIAKDGTTYRVRAAKGVILATGGYSGNPAMLKQYNTEWNWNEDTYIPTTNTNGHTGDGIVMAQSAGADLGYMEHATMLLPFADTKDFSTTSFVGDSEDFLMVNAEGKRFVNERASRFVLSAALMEQPNSVGYVISDANNSYVKDGRTAAYNMSVDLLVERGQLLVADSLDELAEKMGADPAVLKKTVDAFNAYAAAYDDPDFGRTVFKDTAAVTTPPFDASPRTWAAHITLGGVLVDEDTYAALDADGNAIPGLYCVGELVAERSGVHSMCTGLQAVESIFA